MEIKLGHMDSWIFLHYSLPSFLFCNTRFVMQNTLQTYRTVELVQALNYTWTQVHLCS